MQSANIIVAIAMILLGYAVFVFISQKLNPFAIPAKNTSEGRQPRRSHLIGLLAGCLIAVSSLAAWFLSSGNFIEGLKASFIAASGLLLSLVVVDTVRTFFRKRRRPTTHAIEKTIPHEQTELEIPNIPDAMSLKSNNELQTKHEEELGNLLSKHEEELGNLLTEHKLEIQEKVQRIDTLENTISEMQKNTDELTEKAIRLDASEEQLRSVRLELNALETRELESKGAVDTEIEKLRTENLNLKNDVENTQLLQYEIENKQLEFNELKSALANKDRSTNELKIKLHQAALKERTGRLKMEASAKRAVVIARQAISRLNEHEKKLQK